MEIKKDLTPINYTARASRQLLGIVLHSMWGTQAGSIAWFKNPSAQASAHYCISKAGEIVQCIEDMNIAWHAGIFDEPIADWLKPNPNYVTIGIELEDERNQNWQYPQPQREALTWLVTMLCQKYSIPRDKDHILLHKNLNPSRRSDPVGAFNLDWVLGNTMTDEKEKIDAINWTMLRERSKSWLLKEITDKDGKQLFPSGQIENVDQCEKLFFLVKDKRTDADNWTKICKIFGVESVEAIDQKHQRALSGNSDAQVLEAKEQECVKRIETAIENNSNQKEEEIESLRMQVNIKLEKLTVLEKIRLLFGEKIDPKDLEQNKSEVI